MNLYIPSPAKASDFCLPHIQNISLVKSKNLFLRGIKKAFEYFSS